MQIKLLSSRSYSLRVTPGPSFISERCDIPDNWRRLLLSHKNDNKIIHHSCEEIRHFLVLDYKDFLFKFGPFLAPPQSDMHF